MIRHNATHLVRGYAGARHPKGVKLGELLLETSHRGKASMEMEVSVWRGRRARGEVSKIEVVDLSTHRIEER